MLNKFFKKQEIKQFFRYILPVYLCLVILGFIAYITESGVDTSRMFGGLAILGHYLIWIVIIFIVTVALSSILTMKNIKENYNDKSKSDYKAVVVIILKTLLVYMIVIQLINGIISLILNDFITIFVIEIIIELILAPVLIPVAKYFNKDNYVSRKTIRYVYLICAGITIILYLFFRVFAIIFNFSIFNSVDLYIFLVYIIPILIIGLQNNVTKAKKIDKKKEILTIAVLLVVLFGINIGVDLVDKHYDANIDLKKSNYNKDLYCMVPLKTSANRIYYYASNSSVCYEPLRRNDSTGTLYNVDKNLRVTAVARNVKTSQNIYAFPNDKLYYYNAADFSIYEVNKNNKSKKIIGMNSSVMGYYKNDIYYYYYGEGKNGIRTFNLETYTDNIIKLDIEPRRIITSYKNVLIYQDKQVFDHYYRYDSDTRESKLLDFAIENQIYENDKMLYVMQDEYLDESMVIYDMETNEAKKVKITRKSGIEEFQEKYILGVYNNKLYYVNQDDNKFTVEGVDVSTGIAEKVLSGKYFKDMDYTSYSSYLKTKEREMFLLKDGNIYYSEQKDSNKLYKLDLTSLKKEKVSNTKDCYIYDVIDGYVYFTTFNPSSKKNSFRRIKNNKEEIIVE